jgi:hypothetical protein
MSKGLLRSLGRGPAAVVPVIRKVTYPVVNVSLTAAAGVAAAGFGSAVIGDFPEGNILLVGGISYLQFLTADADIIATWSGNYGVGTVPNADVTLTGTDVDLIASAAISAATAKLSPVTRGEGDALNMFDNTDGSLELNLNLLVADASFTDSQSATFTVNGYVTLVYIVLGDD